MKTLDRIPSRILVTLALLLAAGGPHAWASPGPLLAASDRAAGERSALYREGQRALQDERWDDAAEAFGDVVDDGGPEVDAALYWKAYADWKAQRKKVALEGLHELRAEHPDSAWADDASLLEQEIRGTKPAKVRDDESHPESDDEELKLSALEGLLSADAQRSIPVLERLLAGKSSLRVKERALFVLSQSSAPRAREIIIRVARTGEPSLRREAVRTLGISAGPEDMAALNALARDTSLPLEVREAVAEAFIIAGRPDELLALARSDPDPRIREKSIEALGALGATPALRQLWSTEKDPELRRKLLQSFGVAGDVDTLTKIAKEANDSELRRKAIEGLGITGNPGLGRILRELYGTYTNREDKRAVAEALMVHGDAKTLIDLFRIEKDPAMKRVLVQQLSFIDDPEAMKVILDVLEGE